MSHALIAPLCIGEVAFIMQLGGLPEELTAAKARAGIEKLVHLVPQTARVLRGDTEEVVPAGQVKVGDTASSGTVNRFGAFEMEASGVGEGSSVQRMIRLVQSADAGKPIVNGYKKGNGEPLPSAGDFRMVPGRGVCAVVGGVIAAACALLLILG